MKIRQIFEAVEGKLELTKLPYNTGDLAPVLSKDNVEYHYNVCLLYTSPSPRDDR